MWAFQMGFMGAMAFGLGALLVALRPRLGALGASSAIVALLTLGAATAGTALPLFLAVGVVIAVPAWLAKGARRRRPSRARSTSLVRIRRRPEPHRDLPRPERR